MFDQNEILKVENWLGYDSKEHFDEIPFDEIAEDYNDQFDEYDLQQNTYFDTLVEKYGFRHYWFDPELAFTQGDLSKFITSLFQNLIPSLSYQLSQERINKKDGTYEVDVFIQENSYFFSASTSTSHIDILLFYDTLNQITEDLFPNHAFRRSAHHMDETLIILFAEKTRLLEASKEGFPCIMVNWNWKEGAWNKSIYTNVYLSKYPLEKELTAKYLENLKTLKIQGYVVPELNTLQFSIFDMFGDGLIHVNINGTSVSTNWKKGNIIQFNSDIWSIFLAYTLVKDFGGQPSFDNRTLKKRMKVTPEEYLKLVAFYL